MRMIITIKHKISCGKISCYDGKKICHYMNWDIRGGGKCLIYPTEYVSEKDGYLLRVESCLKNAKELNERQPDKS